MASIIGYRTVQVGHRLHPFLSNYIILQSAVITAAETITGKSHPRNGPRKKGDTICAISKVSEMLYEMPVYGPLERALEGKTPEDIQVLFAPGLIPKNQIKNFAELPSFYDQAIAPLFVFHFETCFEWLHANGHGDSSAWSPTLSFARVIRNALAHGGIIEIQLTKRTKQPPKPVSWHRLTYSIVDSGRAILGTDLHGPDLIALMFDVDDELVALGAPN